MHTLDREELAWAAGLFDGEGSTTYHGRKPTHSVVKLQIAQVDRRVLDQFARIVKCGRVYGPHPHGRHRPLYYFVANSFEEVQAVIAMLWVWLSRLKKEQAIRAFSRSLAAHRLYQASLETCAHGHPFTVENTRVYEWHGK